jgi:hypothetical protein
MKIMKLSFVFPFAVLMLFFSCSDEGTEPPGNSAPSITSPASMQAVIGEQFSYTASATDPDNTTPTVTIDNHPSWTSINGLTITGTATQNTPDTTFRVIASDGELADTLVVLVDVVVNPSLVSYSDEIQPIFDSNCTGSGCHIPGPANGLSLNNYSQLMTGGNSGAVVIPGNSDGSIIIRRLEGDITPQMPFGRPPLSQAQIQLIRDWIDEGAINN